MSCEEQGDQEASWLSQPSILSVGPEGAAIQRAPISPGVEAARSMFALLELFMLQENKGGRMVLFWCCLQKGVDKKWGLGWHGLRDAGALGSFGAWLFWEPQPGSLKVFSGLSNSSSWPSQVLFPLLFHTVYWLQPHNLDSCLWLLYSLVSFELSSHCELP